MRFKKDANVEAADGHTVGKLERVVLDPDNQDVTHLVVSKGFLFKEDKVLPIQLVDKSDEGRIVLSPEAGNLDAFPPYEETDFEVVNEEKLGETPAPSDEYAPMLYWYPSATIGPSFRPYLWNSDQNLTEDGGIIETKERNIPPQTVGLQVGAQVLSSDGKHVGDLDQVLMLPGADKATHFVIHEGGLLKGKKIVPLKWVTFLGEKQIRLSIPADFISSLPDYHEPS